MCYARHNTNFFPKRLSVLVLVHQWRRYVDDTFAILHQYDIDTFLEHINSQDHHIQFEKRLFLDTTVIVQDDGSITSRVY